MAINIMNIGASGSGKTCFMTAMAHQMLSGVSAEVDRFQFIATDTAQSYRLIDYWEMLEDGIEWPKNTDETEIYHFKCLKNMSTLADFDWCDYRGKLSTYYEDTEDYRTFRNLLKSASCLNILIPADWIIALEGTDEVAKKKARRLLERYKSLLMDLLSDRNTIQPIIFTITKSDFLPQFTGSHERRENAKAFLERWFDFCFKPSEKKWVVAISYISIGKVNKNNELEELIPRNMHLPAMFAILSSLHDGLCKQANKKSDIEYSISSCTRELEDEERIQDARASVGFWKGLFEPAADYTEYNRLVHRRANLRTECSRTQEEIMKIKTQIEGISGILSGTEIEIIYINGEPHKFIQI